MNSVYFFKFSKETQYYNGDLPENVVNHCKKPESFAAAKALIDMGAENLRYGENGKPVADNCFVSISHSGDTVAVCKGENPVGIDIELIDDKRNFEKLANRVFCGKELEYFKEIPTAERFYEIWTQKEAYSKIGGEGTVEIMKGFDIFDLTDYTFQSETVNNYVISICEKEK